MPGHGKYVRDPFKEEPAKGAAAPSASAALEDPPGALHSAALLPPQASQGEPVSRDDDSAQATTQRALEDGAVGEGEAPGRGGRIGDGGADECSIAGEIAVAAAGAGEEEECAQEDVAAPGHAGSNGNEVEKDEDVVAADQPMEGLALWL